MEHYKGCWTVHLECATEEVKRLDAENAALKAERDSWRRVAERLEREKLNLRAALEDAPKPERIHRLRDGLVGEVWSEEGLPLDRAYSDWYTTIRAEALRHE